MRRKYISQVKFFSARSIRIFLLFFMSALIGSAAGKIVSHHIAKQSALPSSSQSSNWGLSFQEEGKRPVGNATIEELSRYNAFYAENTEEKKIYLTFDAGYENGNTPAILDALKKHEAPATFFVVGNFISENQELIKRMEAEGHIVGNHTMTHPDMSKISTQESFQKELSGVEDIYKEIGPLGGIYSSLLNCKEEYLFITACDMPFITKNSIEVLCNKVDKNTDGVVFYDKNNKLYPLGAIYSKNVLPIIEEMIEKKYYKLSYLIEKSNFVKINIEKTDIPLKVLSNINTLQEYDLFINNESLF